MGVEAVAMDWEDGKLKNNIRLVSIEKSRDELFTSGNTNLPCIRMACGKFELANQDSAGGKTFSVLTSS